MTLSCILAVSENGVIGRRGDLPWHLSADLRRFKRLTMGHTIIMGRKTYESIGKPLPGRRSLVITRNAEYAAPEGVVIGTSLEEALRACGDEDEAFLIGGRAIFESGLPRCRRLYLTVVHAEVEGDVRAPDLDLDSWTLVDEERHDADERNDHPFSFRTYER